MPDLPGGTVTFLFTDIEGSTRLWEEQSDAMRLALARHDAILRAAIETNDGVVFKTMGDAFYAAFETVPQAMEAALQAQQNLQLGNTTTGSELTLKVRMALHIGTAEQREGDYFGQPLNRVARLLATGNGGQILLSEAAYTVARNSLPANASWLDLGHHRFKDLASPEHVWQLCPPGPAIEFPPLRSLSLYHHNLPQQLTSFIGRDHEMEQIKSLLSTTRLLTLTGSGGCGKTRLSQQVAVEVLEQFPDGVWLVELAPLADPSLVPHTVATVLDVREKSGEPITKTLTQYLQNKRLLLVLDNCEHLLTECALLSDALLRSCPHIKMLSSSREGLGIAGELTYRVPSMTLPDLKAPMTPEVVRGFEAVQLFVERALFRLPTFAITASNASVLASVCHRLDGIPLAIELAAARVNSLSLEEINTRLDSRFRLLTGGSKTALPRQQTLRALIDWSYSLLNATEKQLLCRLSVFSGGWALAAVEHMCTGDGIEEWEVLDLLTSLVDKSLVMAEVAGEATRYRMLETVRQYSRDRLVESEEGLRIRARHQDYFLFLAEEIAPKLLGPEQAHWLNVLDEEHDNLRTAITHCIEEGEADGVEKGLRLGGALQIFWEVRGHLREGREQWNALLLHSEAMGRNLARANALLCNGTLAYMQGDNTQSLSLLEESLDINRELGDRLGISKSLMCLGNLMSRLGDKARACAMYEESLGIRREFGDKRGIAGALHNLAIISDEKGDIATARSLYEEALTLNRELGNRHWEANNLGNMGTLAYNQADFTAARLLFEESLATKRELGDRIGIALTIGNLGNVAIRQGDFASAQSLYHESLEIHRDLGNRKGVASALNHLGIAAYNQNDYTSSRSLFEECLGIQRELGDKLDIALSVNCLGSVALAQGEHNFARAHHRECLEIIRELGNRRVIIDALEAFAALALKEDQAERYARLLGAASSLRKEIGCPLPSAEVEVQQADLAAARKKLGEEAYAAAWEKGRAMTLEQAIEYALGT